MKKIRVALIQDKDSPKKASKPTRLAITMASGHKTKVTKTPPILALNKPIKFWNNGVQKFPLISVASVSLQSAG
jgi:hypothetical protein